MEKSPGTRALTVLFAAYFFFQAGLLLIGFLSMPTFYQRVTTYTVEPYMLGDEEYFSNNVIQAQAAARGFTLPQFALEQIVFSTLMVVWFGLIAALIAWRAGWNWFAWYTAAILIFIGGSTFEPIMYVARLIPPAIWGLNGMFWPFVLLYLFLFPNGKPVPRLALWLVLPLFLIHLIGQMTLALADILPLTIVTLLGGQLWFFNLVITIEFVVVFACQVYRYLRVSTPVEKQQTKWFLFGMGLTIAISSLFEVLGDDFPYRSELDLLSLAFIPLAVGIAILRYRLWDIDLIIRRTVTYAVLTALLLGLYFGSVLLLQQLFSGVTGSEQNEIVTVLSTLAIAALFVPLRRRIQAVIDKRLYRKKYDAQRVLNDFAKTAQDETDLEKLTGELVSVVQETMQPRNVSIGLLRAGDRR